MRAIFANLGNVLINREGASELRVVRELAQALEKGDE